MISLVLYIYFHFAALSLKNVTVTPERVKVLVGDTVVLNCSGVTTYNGRINFTWEFPRRRVSSVFHISHLMGSTSERGSGVYGIVFVFRIIDTTQRKVYQNLLGIL